MSVGGLPGLVSEDCGSSSPQTFSDLIGSLALLAYIKGEVPEGSIQDNEEFCGFGIEVVGDGLHCGAGGGDVGGENPAILIVDSVEGGLGCREDRALDKAEFLVIEPPRLWPLPIGLPLVSRHLEGLVEEGFRGGGTVVELGAL